MAGFFGSTGASSPGGNLEKKQVKITGLNRFDLKITCLKDMIFIYLYHENDENAEHLEPSSMKAKLKAA